jgi:adenylate kinase
LKGYIGLTGSPGTGKKSVAYILALRLGVPRCGLNELAADAGLVERDGSVDPLALGSLVRGSVGGGSLVYGHLLPQVLGRKDVSEVIVLRCEPSILRTRLARRGYGKGKIAVDVEAELIGLVTADSIASFGAGKVKEIDTTDSTPDEAASECVRQVKNRPTPSPRIEWMTTYDSSEKLRSLFRGLDVESGLT